MMALEREGRGKGIDDGRRVVLCGGLPRYELASLMRKGIYMRRWRDIRLGPQDAAAFGLLVVDVVCWLSFMVWADPLLSTQVLVTTLCVFGIGLCVGSLALKRRKPR